MRIALVVLAVLISASSVLAEPAEKPEFSPEEREALTAERRRIHVEAQKLERAGKTAEAVELLEKALVIERRLLPPERWGTTLIRLADHEERLGKFDRSRAHRKEVIGLMAEAYGAEHWATRMMRQRLGDLDRRQELSPEQRRELDDTETLRSRSDRLMRAGQFQAALSVAEERLRIRSRLLGESHPSLVDSLRTIGTCHHRLGRGEEAIRYMRRTVEILRTVYGDGYPRYGLFLVELGDVHEALGRYADAEACFREALENRRRCRSPKHRDTLIALNRLAMLLKNTGHPREAEPLLREALESLRTDVGEGDPQVGYFLIELGDVHEALGRYADAEACFRKALENRRRCRGPKHPDTATALGRLALLLKTTGRPREAEPLFREAVTITRNAGGEPDRGYGAALTNLASAGRTPPPACSRAPALRPGSGSSSLRRYARHSRGAPDGTLPPRPGPRPHLRVPRYLPNGVGPRTPVVRRRPREPRPHIRDSFETRHEDGEVRLLRRAKATEEAFRAESGGHRWLHVATHGFFAPPGLKSALDAGGEPSFLLGEDDRPLVGYHPGVLSGLALSSANTPPEEDGDDGILTALEVASLDLSGVELAVLSACETGLGEVAGGEGVLGLQRAFQVAGARTTITSLWKVPDVATQLLMQRFYENLWDRDMGKLEALREAQLWLMREGGKRGISLPESDGAGPKRLPPFYWAGFVLSGDWR